MQKPVSQDLRTRAEYLLQIMPRIGKSMQRQLGIQHKAYAQTLTPRQLAVLSHLAEQGPATMRDLSTYYGVAMPTMTDIVSRLVALKLVGRGHDSSDRRLVTIRLTDQGLKEFQQITDHALDFFIKLLASLERSEQLKLIEAFETIERILVKPAH